LNYLLFFLFLCNSLFLVPASPAYAIDVYGGILGCKVALDGPQIRHEKGRISDFPYRIAPGAYQMNMRLGTRAKLILHGAVEVRRVLHQDLRLDQYLQGVVQRSPTHMVARIVHPKAQHIHAEMPVKGANLLEYHTPFLRSPQILFRQISGKNFP
jgi:hypothetical protein